MQPSTFTTPYGVKPPSAYEIDVFGSFRSSVVRKVSGIFNQSFWYVDVPTAAQVHPCMWHAAIALSAIHHCATAEKARIRQSSVNEPQPQFTHNHHYQQALIHFNKSIRYLVQALSQFKGREMTYMEKEMVILTNIIYIGICGLLEDATQVQQHRINFINMLAQVHFGEEDPESRKGIMQFEDLLSIVLLIDGNIDYSLASGKRSSREWVVQVPEYPEFTSITQAYTRLLPFMYRSLDPDKGKWTGPYGPERYKARRQLFESYMAKLDAFELQYNPKGTRQDQALKTIRLITKVLLLKETFAKQTTRSATIEAHKSFLPVLDEIDDILSHSSSSLDPFSEESPPINFSITPGFLIDLILAFNNNGAVRRKAIGLLKKWPFNNGGESSHDIVKFYSTADDYHADAQRRTIAMQRKGNPVRLDFPNGGLTEGVFDACNGCECVPDLYQCTDHLIGEINFKGTGPQRTMTYITHYEARHNMPPRVYLID